MPIKYSCFISYAHGQEELMRTFVDELKDALKSSLEPYLDEEVYIDEERLRPGFRFNEALARAICEARPVRDRLLPAVSRCLPDRRHPAEVDQGLHPAALPADALKNRGPHRSR
jgi:hypothetical protein